MIKNNKKKILRKKAEDKVPLSSISIDNLTEEDIRELIHELQIHQIELEMQNDELRNIQGELETARAKYLDLYDFAPCGYITLDTSQQVLEANLTIAEMLGVERSNLIGKHFSLFITPQDQDAFYLYVKDVLNHEESNTTEIRLTGKTDTIYVQFNSTKAIGKNNSLQCRSSIVDISPLKKRMKELEDWEKITIDREIKMVELKNQIKELEKELRQPKKRESQT